MVTNLVGNAIKFTDEGAVRVAFDLAPSRPGDGSGLVRLRAAVHDTGIGIPADKHALIFEAFTQADGSTSRRFGGTGLGLSICRSLVELMGGRISAASTPGVGSRFTVDIPLKRAASLTEHDAQRRARAAEADRPLAPLRVPLTALAGWLFYAERIDLLMALGTALILSGNLLNLWRAPRA